MPDLDSLFDDLEPVTSVVVAPPLVLAPPAPEVATPPVDTVGVPFYLGHTTDTYGTKNPYVVALAISSTPCFGTYEAGNGTCATCPLSGSCRVQIYSLLGSIGAQLDLRDRTSSTAREEVKATGTPVVASAEDDLDAIIANLNAKPTTPTGAGSAAVPALPGSSSVPTPAPVPKPAPQAAPVDGGIEIVARSDAKCWVCRGDILKKEMVMFVPVKGMRHKVCPPKSP